MRVVAINLRHGGGSRISGLLNYLQSCEADIIICSEFRQNRRGGDISSNLRDRGYSLFRSNSATANQNSVAMFSRIHAMPFSLANGSISERHRVVAVEACGIEVVGVYFAQGKEKAVLYSELIGDFSNITRPRLLIGDFNTGLHQLDEAGRTFFCEQQFRELSRTLYVDVWRSKNGDEHREYSWASSRGGEFRIDHALCTPDLLDRVRACHYDHGVRGVLTDHSALIVEIAA